MLSKIVLPAFVALIFTISPGLAAAPKTYQATGPILELSDTSIVIQKGDERWEIARTPTTKITGTLAKGAKVTIQYTMTATSADVK